MARMIPAADRIKRARLLIEKARAVPVPPDTGRYDIHYVAEVKDLLQQARDMIKFIPYTPSATREMKDEVAQIFQDAASAEKELLHS